MPRRSTSTQRLLSMMLIVLCPFLVHAADCTYRKDSLGNTHYQCDDGKSGTLRKDNLGNVRDSQSGTTWRKDSLGNVRGSDGTTYRQVSLGNLRASDGTACHTDSLGMLSCNGNSLPPTTLQAN